MPQPMRGLPLNLAPRRGGTTDVTMKRVHAWAVPAIAGLVLASASTPLPATKTHAVSIYAPRGVDGNCGRVLPLKRVVRAPALLREAMRALLAGPTDVERARGYGGWFSASTARHLRSVRIGHGVAQIDFHTFSVHIPNASTSCGSALLLAQLDRTATQFPTVKRAVYSFDGSRPAFYEWLQREAPEG